MKNKIHISLLLAIILLLGVQVDVLGQQNRRADASAEIRGIIKDETGGTIIGASVIAKNQPGLGVISDVNGKFRIKVGEYDILVITYIGYVTQEIPIVKIKNRSNLIITLKEDTKKLDEVVVTASGQQQKKTLTGAYTTVNIDELTAPSGNLTNSLAGVVPGIIAVQSSGEPGENKSEFWIRGISTFGANSGALVLVDGVERSFNEIPIEDIESFSILKDASATAIYGQRGANGVVLVTTKHGVAGKVKINAKVMTGLDIRGKMPSYTDAYNYALLANEARQDRYETPIYTQEELDIIKNNLDPDLYPNVDWRALMLKKSSPNYLANVNLSGGGTNVSYYISLGYNNEAGIYRSKSSENKYNTNTTYERFNYRTNVNINLTKKTLLQVGIGGYLVNRTQPGSTSSDIWGSFSSLTPLSIPRKYSTGEEPSVNGVQTPEYYMTKTGYQKLWQNKMETNIRIEQDLDFLLKGLKFTGTFAFDTYNSNNIKRTKHPELWEAQKYRDSDGNLILRRISEAALMTQSSTTTGTKRYYTEASLSYNKIFNNIHRFSAFAMLYMQELSDTNLGTDIISSIPKRNLAYSGRFTYAFKDRYLVEANWGYTGSENFEKGKQFGFFPAASVGWVISEEPLIKNHFGKWLDMFKIRASYGEVGNDVIGGRRFPYLGLIGDSDGSYAFGEFGTNSIKGIRNTTIGTPHLTWEVAKKYNLGVDLNMFNGMLSGTVDFYLDKRDNIFMERQHMPETTGLADKTPMANVGKMKSSGLDGNIAFSHKIGQVSFTLRANMTYQNTEILDKDEAANELWYQMGKGFRMNQTRGLICLGLFKDENDVKTSPRQDFGGYAVLPGDLKYKDVNGDGAINNYDVVPLGYKTSPGLQYGMGLSTKWKNFDFNILFQGSGKRDFFINGSGVHPFRNGQTGNILKMIADGTRWIPREVSGKASTEDVNARWPRLTYGNNNNNNQNSTFWLYNGRYLRLKNVEVRYTLPAALTQKFYVSNMQVGLIGENLYTWAPFKLWDPEAGSTNGAGYPISKTYSLYVKLSF
jgi:TonB-linked SusC/RagA family outer membrane protein